MYVKCALVIHQFGFKFSTLINVTAFIYIAPPWNKLHPFCNKTTNLWTLVHYRVASVTFLCVWRMILKYHDLLFLVLTKYLELKHKSRNLNSLCLISYLFIYAIPYVRNRTVVYMQCLTKICERICFIEYQHVTD